MLSKQKVWAVLGLLTGSVIWGVIWYPLRLLEEGGFSGQFSTFFTYAVALLLSGIFFFRRLRQVPPSGKILVMIAITSGWANLAYVLAVIHGEVMRVLLLFYLAPLWTVIFSRMMLAERLNIHGYAVMVLSLGGAIVMLWQPVTGMPLPQNGAEWLGLSAGFMFALANVLSRRAHYHDIYFKSASVFGGVTIMALLTLAWQPATLQTLPHFPALSWIGMLALGGVVFFATLAVQYGLSNTPANQAIVIFLFELVVAAISSYFLAGEEMTAREWIGGAMIVTASLFSGKLEQQHG